MQRDKVALLGAGVMGEALLAGMLRSGWNADDVVVTERRADRAAQLTEQYGVEVLSNADAAARAETVVLVVKPQDIDDLLAEIRTSLAADALVVCIAAGIPTGRVEQALKPGTPVVRAMPNTPALVDQGMVAISAGAHCSDEHLRRARELLAGTSQVLQLAEHHQDAVTALSGSGPAYVFYVVEAMVEGGVLLGLPRDIARELVVQTVFGAATMLKETGTHPTVLREQVSSPAGTTISALRELDSHGVRAAFLQAIEAARDRSRELSSGHA